MWGEVYNPDRDGSDLGNDELNVRDLSPTFHSGFTWRRIESAKADVEPFPFVPVICMTLSLFRSLAWKLQITNLCGLARGQDLRCGRSCADTRASPG